MRVDIEIALALLAFAFAGGWLAARVVKLFSRKPVSMIAMIAACAVAGAWAAVVVPASMVLALSLFLFWTLLCLGTTDLLAFRLPDLLNYPLVAAGLLATLLLPSERLVDHLAAALLGFAAFAAIAWAYHRFRNRHGLGLGDAKLAAAAGAWLGLAALPSVLLIASVAGILWIAARAVIYGRRALNRRIAFGLPLCFAIWLVWLYGPLDFGAVAL